MRIKIFSVIGYVIILLMWTHITIWYLYSPHGKILQKKLSIRKNLLQNEIDALTKKVLKKKYKISLFNSSSEMQMLEIKKHLDMFQKNDILIDCT